MLTCCIPLGSASRRAGRDSHPIRGASGHAASAPDQPNELWDFAVAVYTVPGAAEACLLLQDGYGVNVDLLLASLYATSRGRPLTAEDLAALEADVAAWQRAVVESLRAVRRAMKADPALAWPDVGSLRDDVKAAELKAEKLQLAMLARQLAALDPAPGDGSFGEAILRTVRLQAEAIPGNDAFHHAVEVLAAAAAGVGRP